MQFARIFPLEPDNKACLHTLIMMMIGRTQLSRGSADATARLPAGGAVCKVALS